MTISATGYVRCIVWTKKRCAGLSRIRQAILMITLTQQSVVHSSEIGTQGEVLMPKEPAHRIGNEPDAEFLLSRERATPALIERDRAIAR